MGERAPSPRRASAARIQVSADLVAVTLHARELVMLLQRSAGRGRGRWVLPSETLGERASPDTIAARAARNLLGAGPVHLEQVGAFTDGRHPADAGLSVGYLAITPERGASLVGGTLAWFPASDVPQLPIRQMAIVRAALTALRRRLDDSPVAFQLLPATFTLTELQHVYEVLLGHPLHKASFRRALQAADLVAPIDEWRTEGRGRPAQLFRYAGKSGNSPRRGVRFP